MTWSPLSVHVPVPPQQDQRPMISLANYRRGTNGDSWKICITFKKPMMAEMPWLRPGAPFSLYIGQDTHEGLLRIEEGGDSLFTARNGTGRGRNSKTSLKAGTAAPSDDRRAALFIPPFPWVDKVKRTRVDMDFKCGVTANGAGVGWIELVLPLWAVKPGKKLPFSLGGEPAGAGRPMAPIPFGAARAAR